MVNVLLTIQEREKIRLAAQTSGLTVSSWLRMLGLREAERIGIT